MAYSDAHYSDYAIVMKYVETHDTTAILGHDFLSMFGIISTYPPTPLILQQQSAISYQLSVVSEVALSIFDMNGKKVATLVNGSKPAGYHSVKWDASNVSSGIYFYRLQAEGLIATKKMVYMK
jgi:flagellar hook assembly protein FlgD